MITRHPNLGKKDARHGLHAVCVLPLKAGQGMLRIGQGEAKEMKSSQIPVDRISIGHLESLMMWERTWTKGAQAVTVSEQSEQSTCLVDDSRQFARRTARGGLGRGVARPASNSISARTVPMNGKGTGQAAGRHVAG